MGPRMAKVGTLRDEFDILMGSRAVYPVFQPIVSLDDGRPVGFEALARGPEGSRYHSAGALFAEAGRRDVVAELDWTCATAACAAVLDTGTPGVPLFVNVHPATLGTACPLDLLPVYQHALRELDLVLEITEHPSRDHATVLRTVDGFRRAGGRIAIDDVGVNPASMNMISVLAPDVIKLDRSITQSSTATWARTYVINGVRAEAQATGAAILCEGIETPEHLETARSLGATLGQGWLFGRPEPLPHDVDMSPKPLPRIAPYRDPSAGTPFEVLRDRAPTSPVSLRMLATMGGLLEDMAQHTDAARLLFATVTAPIRTADDTCLTYTRIAEHGVTVALFGQAPPVFAGSRAYAIPVPADDPLLDEHAVIAVGSYFAGALIARRTDRGSSHHGEPQSYDATLTYDRKLVIEALHTLVRRLPPLPTDATRL
jgi:EAL domain-containing protein (putative c-di-GMP-specific phosphodiesterase class I)